VNLDQLPCSEGLAGLEDEEKWRYQLAGGDDYELLFTLPSSHRAQLATWSKRLGIELTVIGEIGEEQGIRCLDEDGVEYLPQGTGFEHFGQQK